MSCPRGHLTALEACQACFDAWLPDELKQADACRQCELFGRHCIQQEQLRQQRELSRLTLEQRLQELQQCEDDLHAIWASAQSITAFDEISIDSSDAMERHDAASLEPDSFLQFKKNKKSNKRKKKRIDDWIDEFFG